MFQLDDTFLTDVGLAGLPEAEKKPFLQHIYQELELRVGTRLSEGMSDEQLGQFEAIIDRKMEVIDPWMSQYAPNYTTEPVFLQMQAASKLAADDPVLKAEFASTKWLELNRPNYREVVKQALEELKQEVRQNAAAILGQSVQDQAA